MVLLETHAKLWQTVQGQEASPGSSLTPATFLQQACLALLAGGCKLSCLSCATEQVVAYMNACLLISERLELAVFAVHAGSRQACCCCLYGQSSCVLKRARYSQLLYTSQQRSTAGAVLQRPKQLLAQSLQASLQSLLQQPPAPGEPQS